MKRKLALFLLFVLAASLLVLLSACSEVPALETLEPAATEPAATGPPEGGVATSTASETGGPVVAAGRTAVGEDRVEVSDIVATEDGVAARVTVVTGEGAVTKGFVVTDEGAAAGAAVVTEEGVVAEGIVVTDEGAVAGALVAAPADEEEPSPDEEQEETSS